MRALSILVLAAGLVSVTVSRALACSCGCFSSAPFDWSIAYADAVFAGTVLSAVPFDGPEPIHRHVAVELEVHAVWKGPVAGRLTVNTPFDDFSCGVPFEIGAEHVVYATEGDLIPGALGTILCDRTGRLRAEELDFLGPPCFEGAELAANAGAVCPGPNTEPASPVPPCFLFLRGDSDRTGRVELTDAVIILNWLFLGEGSLGCEDAADANDDARIDLADPVAILNVLFLGAAALPPPGPQYCEGDPTDDRLDCAESTQCPFEE